jgi:hypothetical protein
MRGWILQTVSLCGLPDEHPLHTAPSTAALQLGLLLALNEATEVKLTSVSGFLTRGKTHLGHQGLPVTVGLRFFHHWDYMTRKLATITALKTSHTSLGRKQKIVFSFNFSPDTGERGSFFSFLFSEEKRLLHKTEGIKPEAEGLYLC